jgi:hypothetical protein
MVGTLRTVFKGARLYRTLVPAKCEGGFLLQHLRHHPDEDRVGSEQMLVLCIIGSSSTPNEIAGLLSPQGEVVWSFLYHVRSFSYDTHSGPF